MKIVGCNGFEVSVSRSHIKVQVLRAMTLSEIRLLAEILTLW